MSFHRTRGALERRRLGKNRARSETRGDDRRVRRAPARFGRSRCDARDGRSFHALFGISLRVFSSDGFLLAESVTEQPICNYVGTLPEGRLACMKTVASARRADLSPHGDATHPCFTGAQYRIFSIDYDSRQLGKAVLGPSLPADVTSVPASLLAVDPKTDKALALELLPRMPRARAETITLISDHSAAHARPHSLQRPQVAAHLADAPVQRARELPRALREEREATRGLRSPHRARSPEVEFPGRRFARAAHAAHLDHRATARCWSRASPVRWPAISAKFVETIQDKGEQLLQLIMSLLDLSKLESGTLSLRKGWVALPELLSDVVSTVAPKAHKKAITVECTSDPDLPPLPGDAERLRQVFVNLTDNAIKFLPSGGVVRLVAAPAPFGGPSGEEGFQRFSNPRVA